MKKSITLALLLMSAGAFAQSADENAIKTVIDGESAAYHQRNADKAVSYWANVPYASHSYSEKGSGYLRGYAAISKALRAYIGAHPDLGKDVYKHHDYVIHVNGTSAWATFITDGQTGTTKRRSYDSRYLEKVNGVWKIVAVTGSPAS